ncbi:MAG TPA: hypothetical protein VGL94_22215 [Ktedonobacteraceae bacterium]|jgi:hypothetical protein
MQHETGINRGDQQQNRTDNTPGVSNPATLHHQRMMQAQQHYWSHQAMDPTQQATTSVFTLQPGQSLDRMTTRQSQLDTAQLIPKDKPKDIREEYKKIKGEIRTDWPRMLASRTLKDSYDITVEFKNFRNKKESEWKNNPNECVKDLDSFKKRMLIQNSTNDSSKVLSLAEMDRGPRGYSYILSKLHKLGPTGLGANESQVDLIRMYTDINNKVKKTNSKLTALSLAAGATVGIPLLVPSFTKKQKNLMNSAQLYNGWMTELDKRLDANETKKRDEARAARESRDEARAKPKPTTTKRRPPTTSNR